MGNNVNKYVSLGLHNEKEIPMVVACKSSLDLFYIWVMFKFLNEWKSEISSAMVSDQDKEQLVLQHFSFSMFTFDPVFMSQF